ncbi:MAG: hypothetical protein QOK16_202 [Solirubrobacteraceae bacterium]|nr:hypothetical protein [Solirubrobacteraceae bacterium]
MVAALERFMRDTAPAIAPASANERARWARAALLEGTGHGPQERSPWGGGGR